MSLFDMFKKKPKAEPVTPEPPKAKPFIRVWEVAVPAGFVLPEGEVVKDGFPITIEAGVRWHPEWPEPRVTVNVYRYFHHGDCLVWAGEETLAFRDLMAPEAVALAEHHGQQMSHLGDYGREAVEKLGVAIPTAKQPLSAFYTRNHAN